MTPKQQLDEWVKGNSIHDYDYGGEGQCCPDFSCCAPNLLAPEKARIAFRDASDEDRFKMLGYFLGAGLTSDEVEAPPCTVYISGDFERE